MISVDRIADLLGEPTPAPKTKADTVPSKPSPVTTKEVVVDRQMDIVDAAIKSVQRDIASPDKLDVHVLVNYMDKVKGYKGKLEVIEREIVTLEDFRGQSDRASRIEHTLFDLRVAISRLLEERKKPEPKAAGIPVLSRINLPPFKFQRLMATS